MKANAPLDRVLFGMALMVGFCILAPVADVFSKLAAATLPIAEIAAARFVIQAAVMGPFAVVAGYSLALPRAAIPWVALRALMLVLTMFTFVSALPVMAIADALAIAFVQPFMLLVLGALLLGDKVGPRRIGACVVGFGGALLVIRPSFAAFGAVALWPLAAALFFTVYMLVTRSLSRTLPPVAMQLHTALFAAVLCVPLAFAVAVGGGAAFVLPAGAEWAWLIGVGLSSTLSHMLMTLSLRAAPPATLAPLQYFEIVTAVGLGWAVFGDFPAPLTWVGIAIVTGSGLYILHRERRTSRAVASPVADNVVPSGGPVG